MEKKYLIIVMKQKMIFAKYVLKKDNNNLLKLYVIIMFVKNVFKIYLEIVIHIDVQYVEKKNGIYYYQMNY